MYESIINSKKIKYSVLNPLLRDYLDCKIYNEINIFISLDTLINQFFNKNINEKVNILKEKDKYFLSSELINVTAHYRHYFWSRYGIPSNYYIYYSDIPSVYNLRQDSNYKSSYYDKRDKDNQTYFMNNIMIEKNLKLISLLTEYIPNVYFVNTKGYEPDALPNLLISNIKDNDILNLVLSNNLIEFQNVELKNTLCIKLNMDNSKIIRTDNIIRTLFSTSKRKIITELSNNFFVPILAIVGYKKYDIKGVKGLGPIKTINKIERSEILDRKFFNMEDFINSSVFEKNDMSLVQNNFNILSFNNQRLNITPRQYNQIKDQINNKSDNMSLMEINNEYYKDYPLMLIELMEGEN